jgi:UDP-N-acetylmuramate dehydrogenase
MLDIRENVPLAALTTFKIGGPARYFVDVTSDDEIREAILWARTKAMTFFMLAGGSNVLLPDDGIDGLVVHVVSRANTFEGTKLIADAGCDLLTLIKKASLIGLGGWESMAGIPGSVGGAARGNAGAFGTEIKDVLVSLTALNSITLETRDFSNAECDFAYRHSYFKDNPEWVILRVVIQLAKTEAGDSIARIDNTIIERERRHLQNVQAAGSYFTNPVAPVEIQKKFETEKNTESREGRVPAGWLIEKVGMKGERVGGAIASLQHPNYLVNTGRATSKDVLELSRRIKAAVREKFGVELKEEAVVVAG